MANHGIHRVDRLVGNHAGNAGEGEEKQRRNDTVAQVLRNRFKDGACDFIFGQLARVTPNDLSGEISGNIKISRAQRFDHSKGVLVETAQGEATEDPIDGNRRSSPSQCGGSENQADRENHEYQYRACCSLVRHDSSQQPFEPANEKADAFDRVGQPSRISDDEIQHNCYVDSDVDIYKIGTSYNIEQ